MSWCDLQVYLADYGLSYRYCPNGVHKEYVENPKKGHNGTIEYTSVDAHKGVGKFTQPKVKTTTRGTLRSNQSAG